MKIFLAIEPPTVTHQMHRVCVKNGKPRFYDSPAQAKAKGLFVSLLSKVAPEKPMEGPLELWVIWAFPVPKGKTQGWKTTKPDTDNLEKLLKDCMTVCKFWHDDAQVAVETVEKRQVADRHGIFIQIRRLSPIE